MIFRRFDSPDRTATEAVRPRLRPVKPVPNLFGDFRQTFVPLRRITSHGDETKSGGLSAAHNVLGFAAHWT